MLDPSSSPSSTSESITLGWALSCYSWDCLRLAKRRLLYIHTKPVACLVVRWLRAVQLEHPLSPGPICPLSHKKGKLVLLRDLGP